MNDDGRRPRRDRRKLQPSALALDGLVVASHAGATMLRTFPSNRSGPTTSTFVPVVRAMLMSLTADGRALESALRRDLEVYGAVSGLTLEAEPGLGLQ